MCIYVSGSLLLNISTDRIILKIRTACFRDLSDNLIEVIEDGTFSRMNNLVELWVLMGTRLLIYINFIFAYKFLKEKITFILYL